MHFELESLVLPVIHQLLILFMCYLMLMLMIFTDFISPKMYFWIFICSISWNNRSLWNITHGSFSEIFIYTQNPQSCKFFLLLMPPALIFYPLAEVKGQLQSLNLLLPASQQHKKIKEKRHKTANHWDNVIEFYYFFSIHTQQNAYRAS